MNTLLIELNQIDRVFLIFSSIVCVLSLFGFYISYQNMRITEGRVALKKIIIQNNPSPQSDYYHENLLARNILRFLTENVTIDELNVEEILRDFISDVKFEYRFKVEMERVLAEYMELGDSKTPIEELLAKLEDLDDLNVDSAKIRTEIYSIVEKFETENYDDVAFQLTDRELKSIEKLVTKKWRKNRELKRRLYDDKQKKFNKIVPEITKYVVKLYAEKKSKSPL